MTKNRTKLKEEDKMFQKLKNLKPKSILIGFLALLVSGFLFFPLWRMIIFLEDKYLRFVSIEETSISILLSFNLGFFSFLIIGKKINLGTLFIAIGLFLIFLLFFEDLVLPGPNLEALFFGSLVGYAAAYGKLSLKEKSNLKG